MDTANPILSSPPTVQPAKRSVPPTIKRLILELGLRYRPAAADKLEGYQAQLAALMLDVADVPPDRLEQAIGDWTKRSAFLPKASDLISLAQQFQRAAATDCEDPRLQAHCDKLNAMRWVADSGLPYFVNKRERIDGTTEHFVDRKA